MKKLIISLMLVAGLSASAQSIDHYSNFQINVGGGIHTLRYQPVNGTQNIGVGGLLEVQYQLMFNHYLGIGVGVQASCINASSTYNYHTSNQSVHPDNLLPYTHNVTFNDWTESQHMLLVSVPVQFMFRAPMSQKAAFQAGLGATIDFPIIGRYNAHSGSYENSGYFPSTNVEYHNLPNHGFGTVEADQKGDIAFNKFNVGLLLDLGFVINLSEVTGLYLGLYGNYGLNSAVDQVKQPMVEDNIYTNVMASDRINGKVTPIEAGLKVGIRLGCGKNVDWKRIAAEEAERAEAARLAAEKARQDSIAAAREKARQDSIAAAEKARLAAEKAAAAAKAEQDRLAAEKAALEAEKARLEAEKAALAKMSAAERRRAEAEAKQRAEAEARERAREEQAKREEAAFLAGYKDVAHFKSGEATPIFGELNDDSFTNLKNFMAKYPDLHVTIVGYTDNTGNLQKNYKLSQDRAESIKKMLVERGCDAARIDTFGKGPEDPVADNNTAAGRALNRRIEMTIGRQ